ncbi:hypothetical protein ACFQVA_12340 [Actinomadura keratinilytica]
MPIGLASGGARALLDRYDLVGLDVRGTGRSHPATCPAADSLDPGPQPAAPTHRTARAYWNRLAQAHATCAEADPALLASLTTANAAHDLDALRRALRAPASTTTASPGAPASAPRTAPCSPPTPAACSWSR